MLAGLRLREDREMHDSALSGKPDTGTAVPSPCRVDTARRSTVRISRSK